MRLGTINDADKMAPIRKYFFNIAFEFLVINKQAIMPKQSNNIVGLFWNPNPIVIPAAIQSLYSLYFNILMRNKSVKPQKTGSKAGIESIFCALRYRGVIKKHINERKTEN